MEEPLIVHSLVDVRLIVERRKRRLIAELPELERLAATTAPLWPWTGNYATVSQFLGVLCYVNDRECEPLLAASRVGAASLVTKFTFAIGDRFEDEHPFGLPVCPLSSCPCPLPSNVIVFDPRRVLDSKRIAAATDWLTVFAAREIKLADGRGVVFNSQFPQLPAVWTVATEFLNGSACGKVSANALAALQPQQPIPATETDPCAICGSDAAVGVIELKTPTACITICALCAVVSGRNFDRVSRRAPPLPALVPLQNVARNFAFRERARRSFGAIKTVLCTNAVFAKPDDLTTGFEIAATSARQLFVIDAPMFILSAAFA